jgi:signal transduction histidine kinase
MLAVAIVLLGLIGLLATFQYRWLGQVSQAERQRMQASLSKGAIEFAQDFDRELTRAYLLFQTEPGTADELLLRIANRYDHWQATARFPRLIKDVFIYVHEPGAASLLRRLDPAARRLNPSEWPESLVEWRDGLVEHEISESAANMKAMFVARLSSPVWEKAPAVIAPMPMPVLLLPGPPREAIRPAFSYAILALDVDYIRGELLPALAERHFGRADTGLDFQVAVHKTGAASDLVYTNSPEFAPGPDAASDAAAELLQVRIQDFGGIVSEVRRFTTFAAAIHTLPAGEGGTRSGDGAPSSPDVMTFHGTRPLSLYVRPGPGARGVSPGAGATTARIVDARASAWRVVVRHPAGSLEAAVASLRRRNLLVSSSILGVLGASVGLLVLSTRRAQRLARQQMEFVAAVSHELRTPLAVIRSAADNLADGVVRDDDQVKQYGELVRSEGRRLTAMVEQILELAGIQSGQRGFELRAVPIAPLLDDILSSSSSLIERAGIVVEQAIPADLPPVLGDEASLRRVFQNLVDNAIKYGAGGGWIGISAAAAGSSVRIAVADRGMGIPPAEQARIFEPFYRAGEAIAAQIQGAGLGLSLVERTVQAHGGSVSVASAPGAGSQFIVQLPAAERAADASVRAGDDLRRAEAHYGRS